MCTRNMDPQNWPLMNLVKRGQVEVERVLAQEWLWPCLAFLWDSSGPGHPACLTQRQGQLFLRGLFPRP